MNVGLLVLGKLQKLLDTVLLVLKLERCVGGMKVSKAKDHQMSTSEEVYLCLKICFAFRWQELRGGRIGNSVGSVVNINY